MRTDRKVKSLATNKGKSVRITTKETMDSSVPCPGALLLPDVGRLMAQHSRARNVPENMIVQLLFARRGLSAE